VPFLCRINVRNRPMASYLVKKKSLRLRATVPS
jgi:hypothetical protein